MINLYLLLGRIGLASLFLLGGVNKIINYPETLKAMTEVGLQPSSVLLPLTILMEISGALIIMVGRGKVHIVAFSLAMFTLATNFFFHDFWTMNDEVRKLELSLFFKNVAIAGALTFVGGYYRQVDKLRASR